MRHISNLKFTALASAFALFATTAQANLQISFIEGAPKDRFKIENTGNCGIVDSTVRLDLSRSAGALIFDVTGRGAGVEVFQPLEITQGRDALLGLPTVTDGQTSIDFAINTLAPGDSIAFTIDVDDTLGQREITVAGSEMAGAMVRLSQDQKVSETLFNAGSTATIPLEGC